MPRWTRIDFAESATKHGVSRARAMFVVLHPVCEGDVSSVDDPQWEPDRWLFLGLDTAGVPVEVVGVDLGQGHLLVIHAMKLRRRYEAWLRQALRP